MNNDKKIFDIMGDQMKVILEAVRSDKKCDAQVDWEHGRLVFDTEEDAFEYFQDTEGVESDDVDKEEARFERWFNDCNIKIRD